MHDLIHLEYPRFFGRATALFYALVGDPDAARCGAAADERRTHRRGVRRRFLGSRATVAASSRWATIRRCSRRRRRRCRARARIIFYAGNHRPHKNLAVLYEAWAASARTPIELDLVVTGPDDPAALAALPRATGSELRFAGHARADASSAALPRRAARTCTRRSRKASGCRCSRRPSSARRSSPVRPPSRRRRAVRERRSRRTTCSRCGRRLTDLAANPAPFRRRAAEGSVAVRAYTWDRFAAATAAVYREVVDGSGWSGRSSAAAGR